MAEKDQKGKVVVPAPFAKRRPGADEEKNAAGGNAATLEKGAKSPATKTVETARKNDGAKAEGPPAQVVPVIEPRKKSRAGAVLTYMALVVLPTLLVALYYFLIAADQYRVETRFAVRSTTPVVGSSVLSALGLGLGGASASDTYIVLEYIKSREILKRIDEAIGLRKRFSAPERDLWAALPEDATFEEFVKYWRSMVDVGLDRVSHIITVNVYAFTPEDARDIAGAIIHESERMVNEINERARKDALAFAKAEVDKAEERLRAIRKRFLKFRSSTQQIDPAKQAQVQLALIGKLEEQLAEMKAKLSEARAYLSEKAPTIIYLKNRIRALVRQIKEEKRKLGDKNGERAPQAKSRRLPSPADGKSKAGSRKGNVTLSTKLSEYEALMVEREFAEKFYLSALSGLEEARLLANRQQRYLATFVKPYLPDESRYPKRVRNTVFVFLSLTLIWALMVLMGQSIKDRL